MGGINSEAVYAHKVKYYLYEKAGSSTMSGLKKRSNYFLIGCVGAFWNELSFWMYKMKLSYAVGIKIRSWRMKVLTSVSEFEKGG